MVVFLRYLFVFIWFMEPSTFIGVILAIALGWLIGTERELPWTGTKIWGATGFWGIRTYASIALFWAISTLLDLYFQTHTWILVWALISGMFILVSYIYSSFRRDKMGATSEYAGLITYFIGVIAMLGQYTLAVILAILLLLLLSAKEYFAKLKDQFSREELWDSLKFAVIALVILPLLPNVKYSLLDMLNWFYSWGLHWQHPILVEAFFNPYKIWFFVVVMAGVEYAWYILSKLIGDKWGIIASWSIGGLISSTATTIAMTRKSTEHPEHRNSFAVATLLASCIMFLRVVLVAFIIYPPIIDSILIPGGMMFLGLSTMALYYFFESRYEKIVATAEEKKDSYESPFQLLPAIQFAGLIVVIKFISSLGFIYKDMIPLDISSYFLGLISGLADVDAINLTMSEWARDGKISLFIATTTILIAVMSNNTFKASVAFRFWEKLFGRKVLTGFGVSILLWLVTLVGVYYISLASY